MHDRVERPRMKRALLPRALRRSVAAALVAIAGCGPAAPATPELLGEHLKRGDAAIAEGRYAQALAAYGHARELAPADPAVQRAMMLARVHLIAESAARISPEAIEDARYEATFLLEKDRARAPVYLTALGNILARQGDIEGAKAKLGEAIAADSSSALAHSALGTILMAKKEDAALAKAQFELALKSRPADLRALVGLGEIELAEGNVARAMEHLEAALRAGDDFDARLSLGNALVRQQKPNDAIPHFQRAAALDPKSAGALSALGQALLSAARPEEAERAFRAALQLQPDVDSAVGLGFALARQRKTEVALSVFEKVLADDPGLPAALYGAASTNEELGQKDRAAELYRRLLALPPRGAAGQMIADLQRTATARLTALTSPAASGSASAGAPPAKPR